MSAANAKPPYERNVLQLDDRRHARLGWLKTKPRCTTWHRSTTCLPSGFVSWKKAR